MNGLGWSEIYDFISLSIKIFFFLKRRNIRKKHVKEAEVKIMDFSQMKLLALNI